MIAPDQQNPVVDATMATIGSKATYTGAGASVVGWLTSSEFGVIAGAVIGLLGLSVNWYYRHKQNKREQREHEARMKALGR